MWRSKAPSYRVHETKETKNTTQELVSGHFRGNSHPRLERKFFLIT